jgi:hypothetical protein
MNKDINKAFLSGWFFFQSNMIPERATIFEFCFEKKASGNWCDWMDTIDKSTLAIPATAKVSYNERIQT